MEINEIFKQIKTDGFRITRIRREMINIFLNCKCLLSPTVISEKLDNLKISADRTTIYRELCFLLDRKLIRKTQLADNKVYYEINEGHHHHLICTGCNRVEEVDLGTHLENQEDLIRKQRDFKVTSHHLEFYGLCRKCS